MPTEVGGVHHLSGSGPTATVNALPSFTMLQAIGFLPDTKLNSFSDFWAALSNELGFIEWSQCVALRTEASEYVTGEASHVVHKKFSNPCCAYLGISFTNAILKYFNRLLNITLMTVQNHKLLQFFFQHLDYFLVRNAWSSFHPDFL